MNILYFHAGSGNHGCEALVRTITNICDLKEYQLCSSVPTEDIKYGLKPKKIYQTTFRADEDIENVKTAFSIGGDNYSRIDTARCLAKYNQKFISMGAKTILVGCSISEELFNDPQVIEDLKKYSLITARESITYENLTKHGIQAYLVPDSAFILETADVELDGDYIGINGSNIVDNDLTYRNYVELIKHILNNTSYKVLLIPHVVQQYNDDLKFLKRLKNEFNDDRIRLLEDMNCIELKGYISKCKANICSRTHVSIASYSSCVPTLVVGYSVKSKGIAKDLGVKDIIDYREFQTDQDLTEKFKQMDLDTKHLKEIMPEYKQRCYELRELYESLRSKE